MYSFYAVGSAPAAPGGGSGWGLTGNSATNPSTNYLGTSDSQPLVFRTNGTEAIRITAANMTGFNLGGAAPAALLHAGGNLSQPAWTTNGIGLRYDTATFTDTTSTGTIASNNIHFIGIPTIAASNALTITNASTLFVNAPNAGTNVTISTNWAAAFGGRISVAASSTFAFTVGNAAYSQSAFSVDAVNNRIQVGSGSNPLAKIQVSGNTSNSAWTTNGIGLRFDAATYTDTSSSGTVALNYAHAFATPTMAASSATTYTTAATLAVSAPIAGSNVTISSAFAAYFAGRVAVNGSGNTFGLIVGNGPFSTSTAVFDTANNRLSIGTGSNPSAVLHIGGNQSAAAWGASGIAGRIDAATYTDTSTASSGTAAVGVISAFALPTIAAANTSVTYTDAATLYIANAPAAGTNVSISAAHSIWAAAGFARFDAGVIMSDIISANTTAVNPSLRSFNRVITNTGAGSLIQVNLPAATSGARLKFYIQNTNGLRIIANGSNTIRIAGSVSAAGGRADSTTVGSYLILVAINTTEWVAETSVGTWTLT